MCGTGRSFVFAVLARACACASCAPARLYVRRRAKHGAERRSRLTLEPFMRRDTSGFIVRANISEIMYTQKVVRCCAPPVLSRAAARECSARRKPWWRAENGRAPEGRKNSCDTDLEGTHCPNAPLPSDELSSSDPLPKARNAGARCSQHVTSENRFSRPG